MTMMRLFGVLAVSLFLMAPAVPTVRPSPTQTEIDSWPNPSSELSVMTYNVRGLPWPITSGRGAALSAIGQQLVAMRNRGVQPKVVLLQEAFTDQAKEIARRAGYHYVVYGPEQAPIEAIAPLGSDFARAAQWDRGERSRNLFDSGLAILSDYPIVGVRKAAFPSGACAGLDCLAAKGIVIAWIKIPGKSQPISIVNTHLNSGETTHVPYSRADVVFAWQLRAADAFLKRSVAPDTPIIFGGDFNVGVSPSRTASFATFSPLGRSQRDALAVVFERGGLATGSQDEVQRIFARNTDRIFYRNGSDSRLTATSAWVPFGMLTPKPTLSDHAGYIVNFDVN